MKLHFLSIFPTLYLKTDKNERVEIKERKDEEIKNYFS